MIEERVFLSLNKGERIFAIGDIHGCLTRLRNLFEKLPINWDTDYLVFLGDYIDRGEDPKGVIDFVLSLKKSHFNRVFTLMGNHEDMFLSFLSGRDISTFLYNGGDATLRSYHHKGRFVLPEEHEEFFENLILMLETEDYVFVHAGINPLKPLNLQEKEDVLWIRGSFYRFSGKLPKTVVFGHTPFPEPLVKEDRIGIDTGCVYGGALTCVLLPEKKFFQVKC